MKSSKILVAALLGATAVLGACFSPQYGNGDVRCSEKRCPTGYHCAVDGTCWKNGTDPPIGGGAGDLGDGGDGGDGGVSPDDLAIPPPLVYPPASVWIAGAGGSAVGSMTAAELNVSMGGSIIVGGGSGASGATINLGYFSSGIQ